MNRIAIFLLLISVGVTIKSSAQKSTRRYFSEHLVVDSASTLMFPTLYDESIFTSNKLALFGDFYANIIFYDFKADTVHRLFKEDTFIASFSRQSGYVMIRDPEPAMSSRYIFYRCFTVDRNKNGKIDTHDPAILYVSDRHGHNLTALTSENQNVVSFEIFNKQGFVLLKIQRDVNNDGSFESDNDDEYYFVKLDLVTKKFGPRIELR